MKKLLTTLLLVIIAASATAAPINQKQIASSANWVFHLDQQQFLKSEIGNLTMTPCPITQTANTLPIRTQYGY